MAKRRETRKGNWGKVVRQGMGGFLNPPGHPEHDYSVHSVYGETFSMSLTATLEADWLNDEVKENARLLLDLWEAKGKLPLKSTKVQDWIHQVLGYFKDCYKGNGSEPECWYATEIRISNLGMAQRPFAEEINDHAGVHHIRRYYPEYEPRTEDFKLAYWSKKPSED